MDDIESITSNITWYHWLIWNCFFFHLPGLIWNSLLFLLIYYVQAVEVFSASDSCWRPLRILRLSERTGPAKITKTFCSTSPPSHARRFPSLRSMLMKRHFPRFWHGKWFKIGRIHYKTEPDIPTFWIRFKIPVPFNHYELPVKAGSDGVVNFARTWNTPGNVSGPARWVKKKKLVSRRPWEASTTRGSQTGSSNIHLGFRYRSLRSGLAKAGLSPLTNSGKTVRDRNRERIFVFSANFPPPPFFSLCLLSISDKVNNFLLFARWWDATWFFAGRCMFCRPRAKTLPIREFHPFSEISSPEGRISIRSSLTYRSLSKMQIRPNKKA